MIVSDYMRYTAKYRLGTDLEFSLCMHKFDIAKRPGFQKIADMLLVD